MGRKAMQTKNREKREKHSRLRVAMRASEQGVVV